jgi:RNA polymerase sigma-70 factor (ECF subfamily)
MEPAGKRRRMSWEFALPEALAGAHADAHGRPHMDSEAFAGFYERSARPLWAYLARVSGDGSLAEDLMQESYVRFLCAALAPSLASDGEVAARLYLFRIGSNLLRDHWRRPKTTPVDEVPEEFLAARGDATQVESRAVLTPAMEQMKPRERELLWLAHAEGYSHREIAQVTGLAAASIRLLLFRARRKMAKLLRGQETNARTWTGRAE